MRNSSRQCDIAIVATSALVTFGIVTSVIAVMKGREKALKARGRS